MRTLPLLLALACTPTPPPAPRPAPPAVQLAGDQVVVEGEALVHRPGVRVVRAGGVTVQDAPVPGGPLIQADLVTPGFVDAHAHPVGLGRLLTEVDLVDAPTYAAALQIVAAAAKGGEGWLLGRGWDQNDWPDAPEGGWPRAADLDAVTGDRPTVLRRVDGHAAWVNTAVLRRAEITAATPDPAGGRIVRDAAGAPTGVLIDTAGDLVDVPAPTDAQVEAWLRAAQDAMVEAGLVGVHDMGVDDRTLAAYRRLAAAGDLRVHVSAYLTPDSEAAAALLRDGPSAQGRLRIVGIKAYADGALGSRGAHLSAPYADEPATTGLVITGEEALTDLATRCLRARAQLAVHAIGDAAVTDVLDAFEAARAAVPEAADVPLRVEHAQIVRPDDLPRFAALGAIASVQPTHATSDMPWAEDRLGPERVRWGYTWRSLEQAGATLVFGSDFPVERVQPALGLWAATTRTDLQGQPEGGWQADQRLTLDEAIAGFTTTAAEVAGGTDADDLTAWRRLGDPPRWKAVATVIDGEVAWRAPAAE